MLCTYDILWSHNNLRTLLEKYFSSNFDIHISQYLFYQAYVGYARSPTSEYR